jgi:hypothetical protein
MQPAAAGTIVRAALLLLASAGLPAPLGFENHDRTWALTVEQLLLFTCMHRRTLNGSSP